MERYGFNYSQDIIDLQTKYSLFKRVVNIVFAVTVESGFDEVLMKNAINKMIERNDCLRLRFVKEGKKTVQFVEPERTIGEIPFKSFSTQGQMDAFLRRFRKKATDMFKGSLRTPDGHIQDKPPRCGYIRNRRACYRPFRYL